jgi:hypothetical protein
MTRRATSPTLTVLADARVLVVGGFVDRFRGVRADTAEVWDPATLTFSPAVTLLVPRQAPVTAAQPNCSVLIIGGDPDREPTVERWVPQED